MNSNSRVAFYTLGCKLNFAETSAIEKVFAENGFSIVDFDKETDVIVVNTCSVTASADKKCRNIINRAVRNSPDAYVAVVGCFSQLKADEIVNIPGVDLVLGSREKFRIFQYADGFAKKDEPSVHVCAISGKGDFAPSYSLSGRTRSFLKVQDGCDYLCSYCTIPLARGSSRSASVGEVLSQAASIEVKGVKEVVLTGVNIGDFGKQRSENLYELLEALLESTNIERFRISSIEPDLLSDEIIDLVASNKRLAQHFHIPLQSGCDRILDKMGRRYRRSLFAGRVEKIREAIPEAGIGADIITGFPGETESDFEETVNFIEDSPISYLHVFSYSERKNTRASEFPEKVPHSEKERRSKVMHQLSEAKRRDYMEGQVNRYEHVLFETVNRKGRTQGYSGNYIKVEVAGDRGLINRIMKVRFLEAGNDGIMKGIVIE